MVPTPFLKNSTSKPGDFEATEAKTSIFSSASTFLSSFHVYSYFLVCSFAPNSITSPLTTNFTNSPLFNALLKDTSKLIFCSDSWAEASLMDTYILLPSSSFMVPTPCFCTLTLSPLDTSPTVATASIVLSPCLSLSSFHVLIYSLVCSPVRNSKFSPFTDTFTYSPSLRALLKDTLNVILPAASSSSSSLTVTVISSPSSSLMVPVPCFLTSAFSFLDLSITEALTLIFSSSSFSSSSFQKYSKVLTLSSSLNLIFFSISLEPCLSLFAFTSTSIYSPFPRVLFRETSKLIIPFIS